MKFDIDYDRLPEHIGIIMDGNGRYATKLGLSRTEGHKAGAEKLREISEFASKIGLDYLTVYAFSTENWKRPKDEVMGIMKLLAMYLGDWKKYLGGNDVKIKAVGDISTFDISLQKMIKYVEKQTEKRTGTTINIALGYGGRNEIVCAARQIAEDYKQGKIDINKLDEKAFSDYTYFKGVPDPELIIRPGGESRLSNFLLWECAYSELVISEKLWPEYTTDDLLEAIYIFQQRHRRFGGV